MLILGIQNPKGETSYVAAAFPSQCGKTNLAMVIPPAAIKGYKVFTVGDDIAWLRPGPDGRLWAVNPENGFFGVAPGANSKSNLTAVQTVQKNTYFTNVALKPDGTVWWEGADGEVPVSAIDWHGNPWTPASKEKAAHPNSRFTAPAANCPSISPEWENPQGVPLDAIIFGARRAKTAPLVYETTGWEHGVYTGATMASETTAAATGQVGVIRRDPMAMLPFCGYHVGDYFAHWLKMKSLLKTPPKIFHVNWFRTGADGKFLWPGFGDNFRVIMWILDRCHGQAEARETPIGQVPVPRALNTEGLNVSGSTLDQLLAVGEEDWLAELKSQEDFFAKVGDRLPAEIRKQHQQVRERFLKLAGSSTGSRAG